MGKKGHPAQELVDEYCGGSKKKGAKKRGKKCTKTKPGASGSGAECKGDKKKECGFRLSSNKKCTKEENKNCPLRFKKTKGKQGDNKGVSKTLSDNIMKNITTPKSTDVKKHPWYYKDNSIAAHHIIVSESVKGKKWNGYFYICGYDINHHKNGVMLPMTMESACHLKVPLHRSKHSKTETDRPGISYVDAVKEEMEEVEDLIQKSTYCKTPKNLEKQMNAISKRILKYIAAFKWTITSDGKDYDPTSDKGCSNLDSITAKNANSPNCTGKKHSRNKKPRDHELTYDGKKLVTHTLEIGK